MSEVQIILGELTLASAAAEPQAGIAIAVSGGRIVEIGAEIEVVGRHGGARIERLANCMVMPGLVNAHQHGRGVSQIQLGYSDDFLELWIASRRGRGVLDPYPITKLAAANMLANGVTTAIHANYSYGSGDYEAEVRAQLRAYDEAGIRVTMCVGAMDRGAVVYPPYEACFLAGLPQPLKEWLSGPGAIPYAGDAMSTMALMDRLLADYGGHPRIKLCYGPAGPQWVSDELLQSLARDAERRDLGLHLHLLESPAQAMAVAELYPDGVLRHLERLGALNHRTVLAHAVWVTDEDIEFIARAGATVVRNAGCNLRLRNGIAPLEKYLAHGVRVAIGTDNAALIDDEDLLRELRLAALLAREPNWNAKPPPPTRELLDMATVNGAAAARIGAEVGTLERGKKADLIAIDLDRVRKPYLDPDMPLAQAALARACGADVRLTMVEGRIVYRDGTFAAFDKHELDKQAATAAVAARSPAKPESRGHTHAMRRHLCSHYANRTRRH
jgi:5-methylthioadenosine/S-adenosylhomocysteine deaminase